MLKKQISYDHSITEWGHIQVRQITRVLEDGIIIPGMTSYHRHVLSPGDDVKNQDDRSQKIAKAIWTPDVVAAYEAMIVESKKEIRS